MMARCISRNRETVRDKCNLTVLVDGEEACGVSNHIAVGDHCELAMAKN